MKNFSTTLLLAFFVVAFGCKNPPKLEPTSAVETKKELPPNERFGALFEQVQLNKIFPDGKTFVDCTPKFTTAQIMANYATDKDKTDFKLKDFVLKHFEKPKQYASGFQADTSKSVAEHINSLWPVLTRQPDAANTGSLISLPNPYIVPGGRFGEIYYWDSYFTMLGLQSAGKTDMIENMVNNFAYIIDKVGFIPNGNRTYFLTRSQPPFFARMVQVLAEQKGDNTIVTYLPQLTKEYAYWMDGLEQVNAANPTNKKIVRLPNGSILNRYFDKGDFPRAESYREDVETIKESNRPEKQVYSDLRAACESGWDFSSRWFSDPQKLSTIHTTDIIPVDLNALLYNLELVLAKANVMSGNQEAANLYSQKANLRKAALTQFCWDNDMGYFQDYDFVAQSFTGIPSLAGIYPLTFNMATTDQSEKVAKVIENKFLMPGGVVSTLTDNGQQWDYPNGWAPLQWMTIEGLRNYGNKTLANTIKDRWIKLNTKVYKNTGKLVEKYNVVDLSLDAGGGEYPVQDGFGWTNGVLLKLVSEGAVD